MKAFNKIMMAAAALALTTGLTGCDYLDIEPENKVPEESVDFTQTDDMYQPVSGVYAKLRTGGMHWIINLASVIRDGDVWSGRVDDQPEVVTIGRKYEYNNSWWGFNEMWNQYYGIIKTANSALESLDSYAEHLTTDAQRATYRSYRGEVLILRAYAYYRLTQYFGDVTIIDSNDQTDLRRSKRDVVYEYVLRDLEAAGTDCADACPGQMEHPGALTRWTAKHLAAKIYLNMGEYAKVETLTNEIIGSGKFDLYADYYQLFKIPGKLCKESLMECQATDFGMGSGDYVGVDQFFNCAGPNISNDDTFLKSSGGWNFVGYEKSFRDWAYGRGETIRTTTSFLNADEIQPSGDKIGRNGNPNNTDCWNGKFYVPLSQFTEGRNTYGSNNNVRILRFAEVLLMNSEALVRQGKNGDTPFNRVRRRAQMPELTNVTVDQILDERRMELCCEWGERYNDLIRTGQAAKVLGPAGWTEAKTYYPLPFAQLDLAPALKDEPYTTLNY